MSGSGVLTREQRLVVEVLAAGGTVAEAAQACGRSERTVQRYLREPHVRDALRTADAQRLGEVARQLSYVAQYAVKVLAQVMADKSVSPSARVRAAVAILKQRRAMYEIVDIHERLLELEQLVGESVR